MNIEYNPSEVDQLFGLTLFKSTLGKVQLGIPLMLEGPRGCGKSSIARIIGREFCDSEEEVQEINCADLTNIAAMRDLIHDMNSSSIFGVRKVIILDEVQQLKLSQPSQNVWLKPLDNPNKNVFVIACTTDSNDLLPTFLRRFTRLKVKPLTETESSDFIDFLSTKYSVALNRISKKCLIEKCEGIPGLILKSLPLIDNVTNLSEINEILDLASVDSNKDLIILYKIIREGIWAKVLAVIKDLLKETSPNSLRIGLMALLGARLTSGYFTVSSTESAILTKLFQELRNGYGAPEKANFIYAVYSARLDWK